MKRAIAQLLTISVFLLIFSTNAFAGDMSFGVQSNETVTPQEVSILKNGGVDVIRIPISQHHVQSGSNYNFSVYDQGIKNITDQGIRVHLVLMGDLDNPSSLPNTPNSRAKYAQFAQASVKRYGRGGSAGLAVPVISYEVWNEPNLKGFALDGKINAKDMVDLLEETTPAIYQVDKNAKVVLAGIETGEGGGVKFKAYVDDLYKQNNFKKLFDTFAIHPYTGSAKEALDKTIPDMYKVLKDNGDGNREMWITEIGWSNNGTNGRGLAKSTNGQAEEIDKFLSGIRKDGNKYNIDRVILYNHKNVNGVTDTNLPWYNFAGLFYADGLTAKPAWNAFVRNVGSAQKVNSSFDPNGTPVAPQPTPVAEQPAPQTCEQQRDALKAEIDRKQRIRNSLQAYLDKNPNISESSKERTRKEIRDLNDEIDAKKARLAQLPCAVGATPPAQQGTPPAPSPAPQPAPQTCEQQRDALKAEIDRKQAIRNGLQADLEKNAAKYSDSQKERIRAEIRDLNDEIDAKKARLAAMPCAVGATPPAQQGPATPAPAQPAPQPAGPDPACVDARNALSAEIDRKQAIRNGLQADLDNHPNYDKNKKDRIRAEIRDLNDEIDAKKARLAQIRC